VARAFTRCPCGDSHFTPFRRLGRHHQDPVGRDGENPHSPREGRFNQPATFAVAPPRTRSARSTFVGSCWGPTVWAVQRYSAFNKPSNQPAGLAATDPEVRDEGGGQPSAGPGAVSGAEFAPLGRHSTPAGVVRFGGGACG
jgi:hypothetical protein